ncbi:MAG: glycosyltransferase [Thermomicrobiales bacterium]|nr:glycosyltransferase [Thermomicrobiales bacterium]
MAARKGAAGREAKRVLICTFGSPGDLLPFLALARTLRDLGHEPVIATSETYRRRVEAMEIGFAPVRPDRPPGVPDPDLVDRVRRGQGSPAQIFQEMFLPSIRESFADTNAAADGADLVVSHTLAFTAGLVAEHRGIDWASAVLQPLGFFSRFDPPELGPPGLMAMVRRLGPGWVGAMRAGGATLLRRWSEPWFALRRELGLPSSDSDPVLRGQHSPRLSLGLFSSLLGGWQPDWPPNTVVTGFPFLEDPASQRLELELADWLRSGPPPIIFTLGTTAVMEAGDFYVVSAQAATRLGARAVLLTGDDPRNVPSYLPDGVRAVPYASFGALFPRACAIVHQAGVGTLAQAMRAGAPMLVMPYGHDQPDNAARAVRLGIARRISRTDYHAGEVARQLGQILDDRAMDRRAAEVGERVRAEDGATAAAAAIEREFWRCC